MRYDNMRNKTIRNDEPYRIEVSGKEWQKIMQCISDLQWDFDRMSSCGQETYDSLLEMINKLEIK
tara:strand:+ start:1017 stop:1211 length:195 start_codon:yes stop_codon:yes gene_type:complete